MFVTKQILNLKAKKSMEPHTRQILNEIEASKQQEVYKIDRHISQASINRKNLKIKRPQTTLTTKFKDHPHNGQRESRSNSFVKKMNFRFDEIQQITSLIDKKFDIKKNKLSPSDFQRKLISIRRKIDQNQNHQLQSPRRNRRLVRDKSTKNQPNVYIGYPKQKIRRIIPSWKAKNQDFNMISRCIKGGYVDQADEFCDTVNKAQFMKMKKKFITFDTLYNCVRGNKNKGIRQIKPQDIDSNSFLNMVYYLQNEKNLKMCEKLAIKDKIKFAQ